MDYLNSNPMFDGSQTGVKASNLDASKYITTPSHPGHGQYPNNSYLAGYPTDSNTIRTGDYNGSQTPYTQSLPPTVPVSNYYPGYNPNNPSTYAPSYPVTSSYQSYPGYTGHPSAYPPIYPSGYTATPGYPVSPGYPVAPGYPATSGYPVTSGYPATSGHPVAPGYPVASGYPVAPGYPIAPTYHSSYPIASGYSVHPPYASTFTITPNYSTTSGYTTSQNLQQIIQPQPTYSTIHPTTFDSSSSIHNSNSNVSSVKSAVPRYPPGFGNDKSDITKGPPPGFEFMDRKLAQTPTSSRCSSPDEDTDVSRNPSPIEQVLTGPSVGKTGVSGSQLKINTNQAKPKTNGSVIRNQENSWTRGQSPLISPNYRRPKGPERRQVKPIKNITERTNYEIFGNRISLSEQVRNIVYNLEEYVPKHKESLLNKEDLISRIKKGDECYTEKKWNEQAQYHRGVVEELFLAKVPGIDYEKEKEWSSHVVHKFHLYAGNEEVPKWPVYGLADFLHLHPDIYKYIGENKDKEYNHLITYKDYVIDNSQHKEFAIKYFKEDYEKRHGNPSNFTNSMNSPNFKCSSQSAFTNDDFGFSVNDVYVAGEVILESESMSSYNRYELLEDYVDNEPDTKTFYLEKIKEDLNVSIISVETKKKFNELFEKINLIRTNINVVNQVNRSTSSPSDLDYEVVLNEFGVKFKNEFENKLGFENKLKPSVFLGMIVNESEELESFVGSHQDDFACLYNIYNPTKSIKPGNSNWNSNIKKPIRN